MVNHPLTEFGSPSIAAVTIFLICIMISCELVLKGLMTLWVETYHRKSPQATLASHLGCPLS